jgi:phosphatidate cytidylyltransferase
MKLRILTALPLALLVVWLIGWAPQWVFLLALVVTVELGLYEFFHISRQCGLRVIPWVGYVAGGALCIAQAAELREPGSLGLSILVLLVLLTLSLAMQGSADLKQYLGATSATILGVLYVAFTLSWLVPLRFAEPAGRNLMFLLFLVIWAGDIFAFLAGRSVGRTPLWPRVSPKKTIEGAVAGFAGSLLVAWGLNRWFWKNDLKTVMLWAGLIAVAGQVGDLVESAIKRGAELKDSGTLLPGHGGLLDRIDSLLFGTPVLWLTVKLTAYWKPS